MTDISNHSRVLLEEMHTYFIDLEEDPDPGTLLKIVFNE
jgi:hypothetical protein